MDFDNLPGPSRSPPEGPAHMDRSMDAELVRTGNARSRRTSLNSQDSLGVTTFPTESQTPDQSFIKSDQDISKQMDELQPVPTQQPSHHIGEALENLARSMSAREYPHESYELHTTFSGRSRTSAAMRRVSSTRVASVLPNGSGSPRNPAAQGVPPELRNFASEVVFVLVCSAGQLLFAWLLGDVNVNQAQFKRALGIKNTQLPWLIGSFNIANGLSVVLSGSLTDLLPPKSLVVGAFAWLSIWNIVGIFTLTPSRSPLFFVMRAMQGLAVGVLVSGSMSILGRVYNPGIRKTRVFSCVAAMAPFGFWIGALQGGALSAHLEWIFGSNAIICSLFCAAAFFTIPALSPVPDVPGAEVPSLKQFDFLGALCAILGCVCILFGLIQGPAAAWSPYTYALIVIGAVFLVAFFIVEARAKRPLIPNNLWKTKGFMPLMVAYFLGFGVYVGPWQFYAIQFWLRFQDATPLRVALYLLPNALVGVLATYIVSRTMHVVPGHWIFVCSMVAFALGPVFFLAQQPSTSYWALSMPGVALTTFGPDLSFAAASIFITSNVARSYQGSAGSLLMTVQNPSAAIMTSVANVLGAQVDINSHGEVGLKGLRAIWWFGFGAAMLGAAITVVAVRIPREVEKDHVK